MIKPEMKNYLSLSKFPLICSIAFILCIPCMNNMCYQNLSPTLVVVCLCLVDDSFRMKHNLQGPSLFQNNIQLIVWSQAVYLTSLSLFPYQWNEEKIVQCLDCYEESDELHKCKSWHIPSLNSILVCYCSLYFTMVCKK